MAVPYTFGTATAAIPLSQLDSNFSTAVTIGNTAVQLGNTVTTLNNLTLANVTISSGNVTVSNITANAVTSPAATNLLLQSAGTTAVTIDTSQNVGIGLTPNAWSGSVVLQMTGPSVWGSTGVSHLSTNTYFDGTNYKYIATNFVTDYYQLSGTHVWRSAASGTAGTNVTFAATTTLNANGVLALSGASTSANGVGITFPATQSASSNVNTLDDYEEGTWTPSIGGNATYTNQDGQYTRIGRLVVITGYLQINVKGTGSINVITGMPFNQLGNLAVVSVGYYSGAGTAYSSVYGYMNSNTISFTATVAGGSQSTSDPANLFANSTNVYFSCSYFVAT